MKKLLYFSSLITFFLFTLNSCDTEKGIKPSAAEKKEISVENNMLVFKNRNIYEAYNHNLNAIPEKMTIAEFLSTKEKSLSFISMRAASKSAVKLAGGRTMAEQGIEDDYLASMLNPDGMIQIGEWIFRIDIPNSRVYALHEKYKEALDELKKETPSYEKIKTFSTDEDVLLILEAEGENATSSSAGRVKILCFREGGAASKKDGDEPGFPDSQFRLDCKLVYQKAGIYFSIQAKAQLQRLVAGIWYASIGCIDGSYSGQWKVKCGDYGSTNGVGGNLCGNYGEDGSSWNKRLYESATGLNKYRATATFSASSIGGVVNTRTYLISDKW